jgi:alkylated DNA nucleotide flippase Atl1
MTKMKKSWAARLQDSKGYPKVEPISERMSPRWGTGTVVIPAPMDVDTFMKMVPAGKLTTIDEIRQALAIKYGATIGCPTNTVIFSGIAAHAADELACAGEKDITPYWRTLGSDGTLNHKYPGGVQKQATRLKEEGHTVLFFKGNKLPKVQDYEKKLAKLI